MRQGIRLFFAISAIVFLGLSLWGKGNDATGRAAEAERRRTKAAYIYVEAANAFADERYDDYYMLLRRARKLSPEDPFIAGEMAEMDMLSPLTDSVTGKRAYEDIRRRFLAAPSDLRLAGVYARAANDAGNIDDLVEVWSLLDSLRPERSDVSLNLASILVVKSLRGDTAAFGRALAIYDRLLAGLPGDVGITSQKIRAYSARKDTAAISGELTRLVASAPDNIEVNLYTGDTYAALGMADSAMKYLDRALALEPESGRVFITRARYFEKTGNEEAFDREVFNALAASDLDFEPKFELLVHYVQGLFAEASNRPRVDAMFERLLELNPGEARLHALYGAYEETQDNTAAAREQYSYSLDLDPMQSEIWMAYLRLLAKDNEEDLVLENSRRAARLFPEELTYTLAAAGSLIFRDKRDEALALLDSVSQEALADPIRASQYHATRGDLQEALGRRDSAYKEYTRAIELNPRNAMAMNNMAYFMALDSVNLELARTYASLAVSEDPDNPTFLDTHAWVEFRRKDFPEAKRLIDLAIAAYIHVDTVAIDTIAPDSAAAELIEAAEVVVDAEDVVEDEEPSGEIYDHAGDIYFWNGLHREAVEFWKKAALLLPEDEKIKKKAKFKTYFFE